MWTTSCKGPSSPAIVFIWSFPPDSPLVDFFGYWGFIDESFLSSFKGWYKFDQSVEVTFKTLLCDV